MAQFKWDDGSDLEPDFNPWKFFALCALAGAGLALVALVAIWFLR